MKYKKGTFGYWWTVEEGNEDIKGKIYNGDIVCKYVSITSLDGSPKIVNGNFDCSNNDILKSLKGGPEIVKGDFNCSVNELLDLKGSPKEIHGSFYCYLNYNLSSLKFGPKTVKGNYHVSSNNLSNLKGAPSIINGDFDCSSNNLTSLEGAPKTVKGNFNCSSNKLTSLKGTPKTVKGNFNCSYNEITKLNYLPNGLKELECYKTNITSLEGCPAEIYKIDCSSNKYLKTLKGVSKTITQIVCTDCPELKSLIDLFDSNIKGKVYSSIMSDEEFKKEQKLYKKLGKDKYLKIKKLQGVLN